MFIDHASSSGGGLATFSTKRINVDANTKELEDRLAQIAFTGDYPDLSNRPDIPATPADIGAATSEQGVLAESAVQPENLAEVAITGDYSSLSGIPDIPTVVPPSRAVYMLSATDLSDQDLLHFYLEISTVQDFSQLAFSWNSKPVADGGNGTDGCKLFTGTEWEDMPEDGVSPPFHGNPVLIVPTEGTLSTGTLYFIRYRFEDSVAEEDWVTSVLPC